MLLVEVAWACTNGRKIVYAILSKITLSPAHLSIEATLYSIGYHNCLEGMPTSRAPWIWRAAHLINMRVMSNYSYLDFVKSPGTLHILSRKLSDALPKHCVFWCWWHCGTSRRLKWVLGGSKCLPQLQKHLLIRVEHSNDNQRYRFFSHPVRVSWSSNCRVELCISLSISSASVKLNA